nr:hypothetical protein [Tanacetum cinerariifolium]
VGTLATIKSLKKPCIAGFMNPINSTPPPTPPLHHHSPPPTSSSMINKGIKVIADVMEFTLRSRDFSGEVVRDDDEDFDAENVYGKKVVSFMLQVKFKCLIRSHIDNVKCFTCRDLYRFVLAEVQTVVDILKGLRYSATKVRYYYFLKTITNLDYELVALGSDQDVKELLKYVVRNKVIDLYFEHDSTILDAYYYGPRDGVLTDDNMPTSPSDSEEDISCDSSKGKETKVEVSCSNKAKEIGVKASGNEAEYFDPFEDLDDILGDLKQSQVDVIEADLDVIDLYLFGSDLEDGIYIERRKLLRELRKLDKLIDKGMFDFFVGQMFDNREYWWSNKKDKRIVRLKIKVVAGNPLNCGKVVGHNKKGDKGKGKIAIANEDDGHKFKWSLLVTLQPDGRWSVTTLKLDHQCLQSRSIKACTSKSMSEHTTETFIANPDILAKAVQQQMQKQFQVGVSKIKENPNTTVRIDVHREPNLESPTRIFKRIYVCLGALKKGFKASGRDILGLYGYFMKRPYPGQILTVVGVDDNNGIYQVAYVEVEAKTKSSWCWFLKLLGLDLDIDENPTLHSY